VDRELVPVEHRPFEPAAVSLDREACKCRKERESNSLAARFGCDEQILEIDPPLCEKCRVVVEEERKAQGFAFDTRDYHFRGRVFGEECSAKFFFGGNAGIAKLFISREALDELQN